MSEEKKQGFATLALTTRPHASKRELESSASFVPPITTASTYRIPGDFTLGDSSHFYYSRHGNGSRSAVEAVIAKLEGARETVAFSSGMAAINGLLEAVLKSGDHVVASKQMYGGSAKLFSQLDRIGVKVTTVDKDTLENKYKLTSVLTKATRLVFFEPCSNPLCEITDVKAVVDGVRGYNKNIIVGVDNSFLSPYILKPLALGVDVVMHSCTKYLGGHCDTLMGCLSTNDPDLAKALVDVQQSRGATPSPFDCYLLQRSLWTLEVRMEKHHSNALALAKFLSHHPAIEKVVHPLLHSHPSHKMAKSQNGGRHSGMMAIYLKNSSESTATAVVENLKVALSAVSLGGVHTLVSLPKRMSHNMISEEQRRENGITGNLIRISVGLENVEDLARDFDHALRKTTGHQSTRRPSKIVEDFGLLSLPLM